MHLATQNRFSPRQWSHAARGALIGLSILGLALLGVGCDSGGSSGGDSSDGESDDGDGAVLENTSTVTVDLKSSSSNSSTASSREKAVPKASGTLTVGFHYESDSGSDCNLSKEAMVSSTPYNEVFDPTSIDGDCSSPANFDGVQVKFVPGSGSSDSGLVLTLLDENGAEIKVDDDPSDGLGVSVTVSDEVDLPDEIGGGETDTTAPSAPSALTGTSGDSQVALSWDGVSGAETYNVYRSTRSGIDTSGDPLESGISSTSYTDTDAQNKTEYYYRVTAVRSGAESDPSNEIQKTPFPPPPENRP